MSAEELYGLLDVRVKQLISVVKEVCYGRNRPNKNLTVGGTDYADCIDINIRRLQKFEALNRLKIIYTEMLTDHARTDEEFREAILQQ